MNRPKVISLTMTSIAFPSQWEAEIEDGRVAYIRYRGGRLSLGIGATIDEAVTKSEVVKTKEDGGSEMSENEMKALLKWRLEFDGEIKLYLPKYGQAMPIDQRQVTKMGSFKYKELDPFLMAHWVRRLANKMGAKIVVVLESDYEPSIGQIYLMEVK